VLVVGGCEASHDALRAAEIAVNRAAGQPGEFVADTEPPECLSKYDCVTLIDVLHHIPKDNQEKYLTKLAKTMRPGAMLVLKDIDASNLLVWFNRFHDAVFAGNGFHEIPAAQAQEILVSAGLQIEKTWNVRRLWYPHYFIIARKN
jgi:2-polyprenyl-3-methyl-5-hydroxy-6-metoxy-1,4-benzoquinol methylase